MRTSDQLIIGGLFCVSLVSGCAAPALTEPNAVDALAAPIRGVDSSIAASAGDTSNSPSGGGTSEAALIREAAIEQGFSETEADYYRDMVRDAPPQARPFVTGVIYRNLYRNAAKRSEPHAEPIMLVGRHEPQLNLPDATPGRGDAGESAAQHATTKGGRQAPDPAPSATASPPEDPPTATSDSENEAYSKWAKIASKRLQDLRDSKARSKQDPTEAPGHSRPAPAARGPEGGAIADPPSTQPRPPETVDRSPKADINIPWRRLLKQTIVRMRQELADETMDDYQRAQQQARLSLLHLVAEDLEQAMVSLDGFDDDEQLEFWRQTVMGLGVLLDPEELPRFRQRVDAATDHLTQGVTSLATLGPLRLENLAFCTKVDKFGDFIEIDSYTLKSGDPILIYVEVENFAVEETGTGADADITGRRSSRRNARNSSRVPLYEAELHGRYEIYDRNQRTVVSRVLPVSRDFCRNHRRDFFTSYEIVMPDDIDPGSYTFDLTIEDKKANKLGNAVIDFRIR